MFDIRLNVGVSSMVMLAFLSRSNGRLSTDGIANLGCTGSQTAGTTESTFTNVTFNEPLDNNIAYSYMVESPDYEFDCCGIITQWEIVAGKTGTIQLHVWRRMDTTTYLLIGENYCAITDTSNPTRCSIDEYDRILVRKGDFMGWHNQGNETILYKETDKAESTLSNLFRRKNVGDLYPGDTYDWSQVEAYNDREYGIRATYIQSSSPTVSSSAISVPDYLTSGTTVGRFTFSDTDYMDNRSLVVAFEVNSPFYSPDSSSGYVTAVNSYRPQTDTLSYYVYDLCYFDADSSHAITVQYTTLKIDTLDATFMLSESSIEQTLLHTITCTDPTDQWYCYSTWTTSWPFMLIPLSTSSYGFYVTEYPELKYSTKNSYDLQVKCVENTYDGQETSTGTVFVLIMENQPPSFTNLDDYVLVDAETAVIGDNVFNATATDPEGDLLTYSMTCIPSTSPPTFYITKNGNVQVTEFLVLTSNHQFNCNVSATDTFDNVGSNNLHISVTSINAALTISNMPAPLLIQENMAVGTTIHHFTYQDMDPDVKSWTIKYDSANYDPSSYFNLDPESGVLTLAFSPELDLEAYATATGSETLTLPITVGDVKSSDTQILTITIINENEAPWFEEHYYTIDVDEGVNGFVVTNGAIFTGSFTDQDLLYAPNNEAHTYSLDCDNSTNTHRFYINNLTAEMTYRGDYDLDVDGTPDQVECTVTITDKYGLSDFVGLYIHIKNVNEHTPEFTHTSYTFFLASNTLVGTYLGMVSAVDLDNSDDYDNEITYTIDQTIVTAILSEDLLIVNHNGAIYTIASLNSQAGGGTLGPIYVLASNYGIRTGTTTIFIEIPESTTVTTTTTDKNLGFYESQWSYYWLLATLVGLTMMIIAVSLVCFRICRLTRIGPYCYRCCMKGICCRPPPEQPRGFGDRGYDLASFGHRHLYVDEDAEIDGWEPVIYKKKTNDRRTKRSQVGLSNTPASPLPVDASGRYGTPVSGYGDGEVKIRQEPIYEMFRVPPQGANYLDPLTNTRKIPKWKSHDSKPLI